MPPSIEVIQKKIEQNNFELSKHAVDRSIIRNIRISEIKEAISQGKVIEDYPDDKYGASCLQVSPQPIVPFIFNVAILHAL